MKYILICIIFLLLSGKMAHAYSVLTHEAIIDVNWEPVIVPLLKQRYPGVTQKALDEAHAFAYGGAIAPDMGYYPFGNKFFSDLIHYVRNGDFIIALQNDARNVQEYAFALGVLSHYTADKYGHSLGVNLAVPLMFPELKAKHGPVITYEDDPMTHIRTEFGFDVLQTARGNYASDAYQRFISFEIADDLLKRSFRHNYGLEIDSIFSNYPRSVRTFRWAVKDIFPRLTRAAWKSRKSEILKQQQTATARNFHYRMRRSTFMNSYGREIERTGFGSWLIASLLNILPKVGPLKAMKVIIPSPEAEKIFIKSFDTVSVRYRQALLRIKSAGTLMNVDFDTGEPSTPGEYKLADETHYTFLMKLQARGPIPLEEGLTRHVSDFYAHKNASKLSETDTARWSEIQAALAELNSRRRN